MAFKLICARLQLHASGASKPRLASSASAGNSGCSLRGKASSLITSLRPCIGSGLCRLPGGYYVLKPGRANRLDLYCGGGVSIFDAFPAQAVVYGGIIHAGTNTVMNWTFHATCRSLGLKSGVTHLTCPSIIRVYDSDRSNDAVTLRPRYNSLNQYSLENMK